MIAFLCIDEKKKSFGELSAKIKWKALKKSQKFVGEFQIDLKPLSFQKCSMCNKLKPLLPLLFLIITSCTKKEVKPEIWIYTSLYKDTIAHIQPQLDQKFPGYKINFFQAGSEEVAAKVNAEELAGGTKADILIFSDRFWFEEKAAQGKLQAYKPAGSEKVSEMFKHPEGYYAAVSFPVMVMIYNSDAISPSEAPKTFKEMALPKWKGKFSTGSPLASGTNFTTVAFLQKAYGWDYFKSLRKNDTIAEGGNSAVVRRVQTKERPVGWVLLENALRLNEPDSKIKTIYPEDGAIIQTNVLGLVKKANVAESTNKGVQGVADWFFGKEGQEAMVFSKMYATVPGIPAPPGAQSLEQVMSKAPKWSPELVKELMSKRESIKEEFAKIMLQ